MVADIPGRRFWLYEDHHPLAYIEMVPGGDDRAEGYASLTTLKALAWLIASAASSERPVSS